MQQIADTLGGDSAPLSLFDLGHRVNAAMALRGLGLEEADPARVIELAVQKPYWNPTS